MKFFLNMLCFLSFIFVLPAVADAARIDILPRKIVLNDRERSADITILNLGDKPSYVRVSLLNYRQTDTGVYEEIQTPLNPAFNPETGTRISPRQFSLPPGGRQKIRIAIQKPADLPDGEYRFHVMAISFDEEDVSARRAEIKGKSMALKMNLAVAIPVVFRKGELTTGAKIENISFVPPAQSKQGVPSLKFDIVRTGQAGVMGTVRALQQEPGTSEPKEIGIVSNLNVFSEIERRPVEMPLRQAPSGGAIRLVYTNDYGDKGVFDEVVLEK